jgi:hypothetical protein
MPRIAQKRIEDQHGVITSFCCDMVKQLLYLVVPVNLKLFGTIQD